MDDISLAGGRARRQLGVSASKNALAQLADLKNKSIKRSDQFEVCAGHGGGGAFCLSISFYRAGCIDVALP